MEKLVALFSIFLAINLSAQTGGVPAKSKTASKLGSGSQVKGFNKNDSLMCAKDWKVISVEEWGVVAKPGEKNKNDMLHLTLDGKFDLVLFGVKKSGTWIRSGIYIYFTDETTKEKFNYKIVSVDAKNLKMDYRDPDETHSIFEYE
jgi:hypothetical protein